MRRRNGQCGALLIAGISFAVGILATLLLPNVLIVVLLTFLLLLFCVVMMR